MKKDGKRTKKGEAQFVNNCTHEKYVMCTCCVVRTDEAGVVLVRYFVLVRTESSSAPNILQRKKKKKEIERVRWEREGGRKKKNATEGR